MLVSSDGWTAGPLLVRPLGERNAMSCAEELLCSGGFALVILTGVEQGMEREAVRLSRAAREGGSAFVALTRHSPVAHLRLTSHIQPDSYQWRSNPFGEPAHIDAVRLRVEASAMGWRGQAELTMPIHTRVPRTAADPLLRDRRGGRGRKERRR